MKKKRIWKVLFFLFLACMTVLWQQRPARADNVYSGMAGDCIWYYNQYTHTLTVSGEGELSFDVYPDWHDYASDIQKIEIGDGVTDLHYYAFKDCNQVKSVRIPGSVEMIGSNAFENCTSLTEVVLEEGIQRIGMAAFRYTGLTSVAIPSSVVRIGDFAFEDCRNLTSVTFGKGTSLEKIGYESFYNTGLTEITIPASVTNIDEHAVGFKNNESNYTIPVPNFIIRGREGSAAQTYADQYFLTFENTLITYDLEVDGVPVTNENCDDILENGIFRYDPEKKFLYINGNYQAKTDMLILNKIDRLQIQLEQDSKLDCVNGIISMESLDIFTSSYVLTINSSSNGISMRYAGNDILLNIIGSSLKVTGDKPIDSASSGYGTKLRIYQSKVQATITSAQYNWSAIGPFPDGIELEGCELILPYNSECSDGRIYGENHAWAKNVAIAPVQKYDLWIAGTQVNSVNYGNILGDGTFAYDPDHKVLKIKKSYTGEDATLISSEIQDLVIETAGDAEITLTTTDFDGHAMELQGNTTIRGTAGLVLQGYSMGILVMGNYTVTLDHIRLTINGKYGLIGEDFETASYGVGLYSDRLIIEGSSLLIKAAQEGYAIAGFESSSSGIVMKDCELVSPNNAYVQNGTVFIGKELVANTVEIEAVESYGIDIGDTTVTNHNCGDILGDGAFAYDPKTKTLTIKKSATVKGEVILTSMVNGLVIETVGQEDITLVQACDEPEGVMFMLGCDTTFRGTAKLILKGNAGIIMHETASLTFDHCNVSMEVRMCGIFTLEFNEYGDVVSQLTIDSSSLSIDVLRGGTPYSYAIGGFQNSDSGITLTGCSITKPADAVIENGFIKKSNGGVLSSLVITAQTAGTWKKDAKGWWYQNPDKTYPKNQWKKIDGKWYHFDADGYMQTGWYQEGSTYYYLKADGTMACDEWVENDKYYLDANGKWVKGKVKENAETGTWKKDSKGWWYQNPDKTYPKNQWKKIDGKWYRFDANGYRITGWYQEGSVYYYFKEDGTMACDEWVENDKYYLDANGKWVKGKVKENAETGTWKKDAKGWWYQNPDKTYPKNQWKKIDGKWYHFDADGYMQTGWYKEGNYYYYLKSNGTMAADEWVENDKYYIDANGHWVEGAKK